MRDSVKVDGITLTQAQVKQAWEELNKPDPFRPGAIVITRYKEKYIVVDDRTREHLVFAWQQKTKYQIADGRLIGVKLSSGEWHDITDSGCTASTLFG
jgi:hypothetical protein